MTQHRSFVVSPVERNIGLNAGRMRKEAQSTELGWSLADMCRKLSAKDRTIKLDPASLKRIEAGEQRIRHSEAIAFSRVFDVDLAILQLPPQIAGSQKVRELAREWGEASREAEELAKRSNEAFDRVLELETRMGDSLTSASDPGVREQALLAIFEVRRALYGFNRQETETGTRLFYAERVGLIPPDFFERARRGEDVELSPALHAWIYEGGEFPDGDA